MKVLFPIPKHDQAMAHYFKELIETGKFSPVIDRRYVLDDIVEAYRYVESGQKTGNVIIRVDDSGQSGQAKAASRLAQGGRSEFMTSTRSLRVPCWGKAPSDCVRMATDGGGSSRPSGAEARIGTDLIHPAHDQMRAASLGHEAMGLGPGLAQVTAAALRPAEAHRLGGLASAQFRLPSPPGSERRPAQKPCRHGIASACVGVEDCDMPQTSWSNKDEQQYEHIKDST